MGRAIESAEVLIALTETPEGINLEILPRDEAPNSESLAVILASFIDSNFETLMKAAVQAKEMSERADVHVDGGDMRVVATRPVRSVTSVEGGIAKEGPRIVDAQGRAL